VTGPVTVTHGSWVTWVMGQELNGSLGSWFTLSDPALHAVCRAGSSAPAELLVKVILLFETFLTPIPRQT